MREHEEERADAWFALLDEIVEGFDAPAPQDDELITLARTLSTELAPLRELDAPARARREQLRTRLHSRARSVNARSLKKWLMRPLLAAAALLLFFLLGPGLIFEVSPGVGQNQLHNQKGISGWQMADLPSTTFIMVIPPLKMPRGLQLLLPTEPGQSVVALSANSYGAPVTNNYLVYEAQALIYEMPSQPLPVFAFESSLYQTVPLGYANALLMQTRDGQNRLEWYQDGLLCDMVSNQPVALMIQMAQDLRVASPP